MSPNYWPFKMYLFLIILSTISAVAVSAVKPPRTIQNTCPSELVESEESYLRVKGDYCYRFVIFKRKDFYEATQDCNNYNGTLVLVKDWITNDYLVRKLRFTFGARHPVWIGLEDTTDTEEFSWQDGTALGWDHFAPGTGLFRGYLDIRRKLTNCVTLNLLDRLWYDNLCSGSTFSRILTSDDPRKNYICQFTSVLPDVTTPTPTTENPTTESPTSHYPITQSSTTQDPTTRAPNTTYPTFTIPTTHTLHDCPPWNCDKDCGWYGYVTDDQGCPLCECPPKD